MPITHVLCLCLERLETREEKELREQLGSRQIAYAALPARDDPAYLILHEHLESARRVALAAREAGGAVLVQCWGGCNRALAVGTALLMSLDKLPLVDACRAVQGVRGEVLTNKGFRRQLLQLAAVEGLLQETTLPRQLPCGHGGRYRWDTEGIEDFLHLLHVAICSGNGLFYRDGTGERFGDHLNCVADQRLWHRHATLVRRWVLTGMLLHQLGRVATLGF
jgi:protein-tyrosine phosphatase